jgi:hypothetical protein
MEKLFEKLINFTLKKEGITGLNDFLPELEVRLH